MKTFFKSYFYFLSLLFFVFCTAFLMEHSLPALLAPIIFTHFFTAYDFLYLFLLTFAVSYPLFHSRFQFEFRDMVSLPIVIFFVGLFVVMPSLENLISRLH